MHKNLNNVNKLRFYEVEKLNLAIFTCLLCENVLSSKNIFLYIKILNLNILSIKIDCENYTIFCNIDDLGDKKSLI